MKIFTDCNVRRRLPLLRRLNLAPGSSVVETDLEERWLNSLYSTNMMHGNSIRCRCRAWRILDLQSRWYIVTRACLWRMFRPQTGSNLPQGVASALQDLSIGCLSAIAGCRGG